MNEVSDLGPAPNLSPYIYANIPKYEMKNIYGSKYFG
jgi:hypothetical protein